MNSTDLALDAVLPDARLLERARLGRAVGIHRAHAGHQAPMLRPIAFSGYSQSHLTGPLYH